MNENRKCPQCDQVLTNDSPSGICPGCLVRAGMLENESSVERTTGSHSGEPFDSLPVGELQSRFPDFEILELLGQGGMGSVYKARQIKLDRLVAIKILPPEIGRNRDFAERFVREAKAMAQLNHPHILTIHDFGEAEGLFFFVMEYVDGVNLRQAMQRQDLTPPDAMAIVSPICDALQYAHDRGIVHRDIKPENILLNSAGQPKIADFGLSKLVGKKEAEFSLTETHQVMGTPRYMAPEQMQETRSVDHRADIFSLGVLFYELLTGELPIGNFPSPSKKVRIDVRLDEVVLKTLENEPEQRYQKVSEFRTEVEKISDLEKKGEALHSIPVKWIPDTDYSRRIGKLCIAFWVAWSLLIAWGLTGYLMQSAWYLEKDFPRSLLDFGLLIVGWMLTIFLGLDWYLLAKSPHSQRSFNDFLKTFSTPDPRAVRLWLPMGIYVGINLAIVLAGFFIGDRFLAVTTHLLVMFAPLAVMWSCRTAYPIEPSSGNSKEENETV